MPSYLKILKKHQYFEEEPLLVFWKKKITPADGPGWDYLTDGEFYKGYVKVLAPSEQGWSRLFVIESEEFWDTPGIDYSVKGARWEGYTQVLLKLGLVPGDPALFQNAVYPLAPKMETLQTLGCQDAFVPEGANILLFCWLCDYPWVLIQKALFALLVGNH